MPQVGIQRLGTGHAQHHRAQNDEGGARVLPHETHRVMRADGPQNFRMGDDLRDTQQRQHRKPDQRDRSKKFTDASRAMLLHRKQRKQNQQRDRDHTLFKGGRNDFQSFDCRQHRDGRCDHTIAIKQRGAKNPENQQPAPELGFVLDGHGGQRQHGDQPAFAVVVGAQHQCHVLDGDDDCQRPDKHRQNAVDVVGREGDVPRAENFLQRVQDAGSDVAVDDTDGANCQRGEG